MIIKFYHIFFLVLAATKITQRNCDIMCICVTLTVAFVALLIYFALGRKKLQYHGFKVTGGKTIIVTGAEQGI